MAVQAVHHLPHIQLRVVNKGSAVVGGNVQGHRPEVHAGQGIHIAGRIRYESNHKM